MPSIYSLLQSSVTWAMKSRGEALGLVLLMFLDDQPKVSIAGRVLPGQVDVFLRSR